MINRLFRIAGLLIMFGNVVLIASNINFTETNIDSKAVLLSLNILWILFCIEREIDDD